MTEPAFDQLLRRLSEAEVEFVLIGGLAVNAWGVVRGTKDVDVVVAPDLENLKRVAGVAVAVHGHIQTGESFLSTPPDRESNWPPGNVAPMFAGESRKYRPRPVHRKLIAATNAARRFG